MCCRYEIQILSSSKYSTDRTKMNSITRPYSTKMAARTLLGKGRFQMHIPDMYGFNKNILHMTKIIQLNIYISKIYIFYILFVLLIFPYS